MHTMDNCATGFSLSFRASSPGDSKVKGECSLVLSQARTTEQGGVKSVDSDAERGSDEISLVFISSKESKRIVQGHEGLRETTVWKIKGHGMENPAQTIRRLKAGPEKKGIGNGKPLFSCSLFIFKLSMIYSLCGVGGRILQLALVKIPTSDRFPNWRFQGEPKSYNCFERWCHSEQNR